MEEKKAKEKPSKSSKQILLVLAKKIKIMDEQAAQLRMIIDDLEDRIGAIEDRVMDDREVHFRSDFDW